MSTSTKNPNTGALRMKKVLEEQRDQVTSPAGRVELITGPMFAGGTTQKHTPSYKLNRPANFLSVQMQDK